MLTRRTLFALSFVVACGGGQNDVKKATPPAPETAPRYTAEQFFKTTSILGASFSHDETRLLVTSDKTGVFNVYAQPVVGGEPVALTSSTKESIYGVSYFPKDDRFLYSSDKGGNELNHIFVRETNGSVRDLTPGAKTKASFAGWSGDKKYFYLETNERDPRFFDLYRYAADGYQRTLLFKNDKAWQVGGVSDDGRWVALSKVHNNADSDVFVWDATKPDAAPKHITEHKGMVQHAAMGFTPDSSKLIYATDGHGEFRQLWTYELASGKRALHTKADWDVSYAYYSEKGTYLATAINADAQTKLTVVRAATGTPVATRELPAGNITAVSFSPSETKMAFYLSSDRTSRNLYVLDLATGAHKQLTNTMNAAIDSNQLVDGQVVRFASFDGLKIPALLYKPRQASATNKVPVMLFIHGGPGGQTRLGYRPMFQHLVNHGYAIFAVNNRGSSGYGKTFNHLDDKKHGDVDLKDCVWARRYLETLDWVKRDRIGIMGGSYGGYMVLAALAFTPDVFDVGIDIFGVSNWIRTLKSIPPWWASFKKYLDAELGTLEADGERLRRISPLFHASKIKKPLLVVQGVNDPRVVKAESDEIVAAVKKNGVPVEYVLFPDEGHGFAKVKNRIRAQKAYLEFLKKHLP